MAELVRKSEDPDVEPVYEGGFRKITYGFVTQTFGEDGKCTGQEFVAGDQCEFEDVDGESIDEQDEEYQPYNMVQPGVDYYYLQMYELVSPILCGPWPTKDERDAEMDKAREDDYEWDHTFHDFELPKGTPVDFV